jgi:hypothetical protein
MLSYTKICGHEIESHASVVLILVARRVVGNALFQQLWVGGVDQICDLLQNHCFIY